jgi:hypothetical protein
MISSRTKEALARMKSEGLKLGRPKEGLTVIRFVKSWRLTMAPGDSYVVIGPFMYKFMKNVAFSCLLRKALLKIRNYG